MTIFEIPSSCWAMVNLEVCSLISDPPSKASPRLLNPGFFQSEDTSQPALSSPHNPDRNQSFHCLFYILSRIVLLSCHLDTLVYWTSGNRANLNNLSKIDERWFTDTCKHCCIQSLVSKPTYDNIAQPCVGKLMLVAIFREFTLKKQREHKTDAKSPQSSRFTGYSEWREDDGGEGQDLKRCRFFESQCHASSTVSRYLQSTASSGKVVRVSSVRLFSWSLSFVTFFTYKLKMCGNPSHLEVHLLPVTLFSELQ